MNRRVQRDCSGGIFSVPCDAIFRRGVGQSKIGVRLRVACLASPGVCHGRRWSTAL